MNRYETFLSIFDAAQRSAWILAVTALQNFKVPA
jgi:hypothetical protein